MIFSPFFTRFGRERPAKKPRWAIFSLVFALEIAGETAVFCKGFAKGADLARAAGGEEGKVGKRVFFAGFPFGLSPAVCTRVRQARSAGCAASRMMKGSWAKSRHVSRNSCALFHGSRAVLPASNATTPPAPTRRGWGWGDVAAVVLLGGGGAGRSGAARREGRATRRNGNGTCHRSGAGAPRKRGTGRSRHTIGACARMRRDQKRGPPPPGPPPGCTPPLPGCTGRKLPPGRSPPGWPSGGSGILAPPKMLRR